MICHFASLKILQSPNFKKFREVFQADLQSLFIVPANTFYGVTGRFPIGFYLWETRPEWKVLYQLYQLYQKHNELILVTIQ